MSADQIVEAVRAKMLARSLVGQEKYGCTLMREDLDTLDWIRHAQEEAMDMAIYLERLYRDIERMMDDGR
jgi:hypothetical protein